MGASRSRRLRLAAFAAMFAAGAAAAQSQVGPPIRLGPPPPPKSDDSEPGDTPKTSQDITVGDLAPPDPDSAGSLSADDRPLPPTMWHGTSRATVLALLPRISSTTSPALGSLLLRLLASPAVAPEGDAPPGALLALRAERLTNALGRTGAALGLLQAAPLAQSSEAMGEVSVDLAFLNGDTSRACAIVKGRDHGWQETYWDQGAVTCQALDGHDADARLGLDMLREAKFKDDGFSALVESALGGGGRTPDALPAPQPMALALLGKAGMAVPRKSMDSANLAVLRAVALGSGFPPDQRLFAAEKAVTYGALAPEKLAEAYLAVLLDPEDRESPLNRAQAAGGARGRAILFAAARSAQAVPARANFLVTLLDKAPKSDLYFAVVRAAQSMLVELPPEPALASEAPDFARALYALDKPAEAGRWLAIAAPEAAAPLMPLAHIVSDRLAPAWGTTNFEDLLRGVTKDTGLVGRRATLAAQLLTALGSPPPAALLLPLLDQRVNVPPNAAPGLLVDSEAAAHHLGGTVLTVAVALGDQGAMAPAATVAQAVAALRDVGLADDARRLATDAAIAAGL